MKQSMRSTYSMPYDDRFGMSLPRSLWSDPQFSLLMFFMHDEKGAVQAYTHFTREELSRLRD